MERVLPWIALLFAVGAIALAVFEIDQRADEAPLAVPSPTRRASPLATESPEATATVRPTASPTAEPTVEPTQTEALPSTTRTATPAPAPSATVTPKPPPTPTPSAAVAAVTPGPTDGTRGSTPHTGGGALIPGLAIAVIALLGRASLRLNRR
jgi:cytoskeletal protein RodZ